MEINKRDFKHQCIALAFPPTCPIHAQLLRIRNERLRQEDKPSWAAPRLAKKRSDTKPSCLAEEAGRRFQ